MIFFPLYAFEKKHLLNDYSRSEETTIVISFEISDKDAEELERDIAVPVEKAMEGISGLNNTLSICSWDGCSIMLQFSSASFQNQALPIVKEKLGILQNANLIPLPAYVLKRQDCVPFGKIAILKNMAEVQLFELIKKVSGIPGISRSEYTAAATVEENLSLAHIDSFYDFYIKFVFNSAAVQGAETYCVMPLDKRLYRYNGNPCSVISLLAESGADAAKLQQEIDAVLREYAGGGNKLVCIKAGMDKNCFSIHVEQPVSIKQRITNDTVAKIEAFLKGMPAVTSVLSEIVAWSGTLRVSFVSPEAYETSVAEIIRRIDSQSSNFEPAVVSYEPGQEAAVKQTKEIFIDVLGPDYTVLKDLAIRISQQIKGITGLSDIKIRMREGRACLTVNVDAAAADEAGLRGEEIVKQAMVYSQYPGFRNFHSLAFLNSQGKHVPFNSIAHMRYEIMPSEIWRKNGSHMVQVSATIADTSSVTKQKVRQALSAIDFPQGYSCNVGSLNKQLPSGQT